MSKVSICIPAYNHSEHLKKALDSVIAQDFEDYEVVVTDDSSDDSVAVLLARYDFSGRLRYLRNPRRLGSPENWNEGIRVATGEFVKILHHDDALAGPGALRGFVNLMEAQRELRFGFAASRVRDETEGRSWNHSPSVESVRRIAAEPELLFLANLIGGPSAVIFRRDLGIAFDPDLEWLVDVDFYIRAIGRSRGVAYTPDVLVVTCTNARHQITERCKDNPRVELSEHLRVFAKISPVRRHRWSFARKWIGLLRRFKIRSLEDLRSISQVDPEPRTYFLWLFRLSEVFRGLRQLAALGVSPWRKARR